MALNIEKIREDFPILHQKVNNHPLIYLDNAATTQRPLAVIGKEKELSCLYNANIHRGTHHMAILTTEAFEEARRVVKDFINAPSTEEVIFTHGTTESINLVARSLGESLIGAGDEIIVSEMEHHANIVPWQMLCERVGAVLRVLPFNDTGILETGLLDDLLTPRTRLLAVAHVSNTLGTINPIREIVARAHQNNTLVLVDGAQSSPHLQIDVQDLGCDFFVFSGHKIYGPTGIGVLYGKKELLEKMPPFLGGGEMIESVTFAKTTYNALPHKFEAGTPHYTGAIAMAEAIRYLQQTGREEIAAYEEMLLHYTLEQLRSVEGIRIFGEAPHKSGAICLQFGNLHPFDLGTLLDQFGIAVRTGRMCADPVMDHYGVNSMLRVSAAFYNTKEEIDFLIATLLKIKTKFKHFQI